MFHLEDDIIVDYEEEEQEEKEYSEEETEFDLSRDSDESLGVVPLEKSLLTLCDYVHVWIYILM